MGDAGMHRNAWSRSRSSTRTAGLVLSLLLITAYGCGIRSGELVGGSLGITLNGRGEIRRLADLGSGRNYSPRGITSPLLSVRIDSVLHAPRSSRWDRQNGLLTLRYPGDVSATVRVVIDRCVADRVHESAMGAQPIAKTSP